MNLSSVNKNLTISFILKSFYNISPRGEILRIGVLRTKLFNIVFASCSFKNLDFLLLHTSYFDSSVALLLVFETLRFMFSVFSTV